MSANEGCKNNDCVCQCWMLRKIVTSSVFWWPKTPRSLWHFRKLDKSLIWTFHSFIYPLQIFGYFQQEHIKQYQYRIEPGLGQRSGAEMTGYKDTAPNSFDQSLLGLSQEQDAVFHCSSFSGWISMKIRTFRVDISS